MTVGRSTFGCCYSQQRQELYVAGGYSNGGEALKSCERYSI
jgi:hypothetical protein